LPAQQRFAKNTKKLPSEIAVDLDLNVSLINGEKKKGQEEGHTI
jgi:hypothetical protein